MMIAKDHDGDAFQNDFNNIVLRPASHVSQDVLTLSAFQAHAIVTGHEPDLIDAEDACQLRTLLDDKHCKGPLRRHPPSQPWLQQRH
jgi:hypothetical protein